MDYCPQCRRHLNGALACAGCGTPAEVLRQRTTPPPGSHHSGRPDHEGRLGLSGARHGEREEEHAPEGPEGPEESADTAEEVYELSGHGPEHGSDRRRRSSRRKSPSRTGPRRARSKRGRRVLMGTLGVVLAVAALSLAQLAIEAPGGGRDTAVKEETPVDFEGGPRDTDRPEASGDPRPVVSSGRPGSGSPGPGSASASGEGPGSGSAQAPASASGTPSAGATSSDRPQSPAPDDSTPGTTGPPDPTDGPTSARPTPTGTAPGGEEPPEPEPTKTCTTILWFCF
ncbi:hypothetical protein ABZ707_02850 [Streptomyces sp. NPDC006923]|uniref:SCO2400 family protein n=1 Tax=Streptomyces sp. NPDC006923 TaxID=3155355 RepID=UPI0033DCB687